MPDGRVNANPVDVERLAAALRTYQTEVAAAGKKVQGALNAASWHDPQKDKFEARYRELQKSLGRFMSGEVTGMIKSLNELARRLRDISSTKF